MRHVYIVTSAVRGVEGVYSTRKKATKAKDDAERSIGMSGSLDTRVWIELTEVQ